jgi:hypothetical protein
MLNRARLLSSRITLLRVNRPSTTLLAKQASSFTFQTNISDAQMFIIDVALNIAGYSGSTEVASLLQAFESLNIAVTLPGLKTNLLGSAAVESKYIFSLLCPFYSINTPM